MFKGKSADGHNDKYFHNDIKIVQGSRMIVINKYKNLAIYLTDTAHTRLAISYSQDFWERPSFMALILHRHMGIFFSYLELCRCPGGSGS